MVYCIALSSKTVNAIASFLGFSSLFPPLKYYIPLSFSRNTRCGFFSLSPRAASFHFAFHLRTHVERADVFAEEIDRAL